MKHSSTSLLFTRAIVKICYFLLFAAAALASAIVFKEKLNLTFTLPGSNLLEYLNLYIMVPFYIVVPAGYAALVCLDRLLLNVSRKEIFERKNVTLLRILSYCCFFAAAAGIVSFFVIMKIKMQYETLLILSLGEAFVGLVVRVVKNIFESAIEIKEENDLTV